MDVTLVTATRADRHVFERLLQLYEYEYSENAEIDLDADGLFPTVDTKAIWQPDYHVFFIKVSGKFAGFALVTRHQSYVGEGETYLIDEFFVLRRYQRRGVGEHVARSLFDRFPGRWEVSQLPQNVAAKTFWWRVIDRYTAGRFQETELDNERWRGPVQAFTSGARD